MISLKRVRNTAWNAMKHVQKKDGALRNDEELLAGRWSHDNEAILMEGWFNLSQAGVPLPVEAQVFLLWMPAQHAHEDQIDEAILELFPGFPNVSEEERHRALLDAISLAVEKNEVMTSARTDPRQLILPK